MTPALALLSLAGSLALLLLVATAAWLSEREDARYWREQTRWYQERWDRATWEE